MPQKGQIKRAFPLQSRRQHRESHIMMLPSVQFPVPGTCSSRVSWAKCPSILFITKWFFPGVLKIILWHILSLPTSCKELLNSQRKNNFALILTLNVIALWTCTSVSPWLQHSEKETVKQLLIPEYKQKKSKTFWKRLKLWTLPYFCGTLGKESTTSHYVFIIFQADIIGTKLFFMAAYTTTLSKLKNANLSKIKISIQRTRMFW